MKTWDTTKRRNSMNKTFLTEEEYIILEELRTLKRCLAGKPTLEEKSLQTFLDNTDDEELKDSLQKKLEEIRRYHSVSPEEAVERLQTLGYSHATVLRHGVSGIIGVIMKRARSRVAGQVV
jgi:hypothetical protein